MEALVALRDTLPSIKYKVGGDGDDRPRLESEVERLGLTSSVEFLGAIPESDLPAVYNACDIFILLSAFELTGKIQGEGVPLVVLEAQACGKPVITSSLDGSAESIDDLQTGLLVDPNDLPAIVGAITQLRKPEIRASMGAAARSRSINVSSFEVFARELAALALTFPSH